SKTPKVALSWRCASAFSRRLSSHRGMRLGGVPFRYEISGSRKWLCSRRQSCSVNSSSGRKVTLPQAGLMRESLLAEEPASAHWPYTPDLHEHRTSRGKRRRSVPGEVPPA